MNKWDYAFRNACKDLVAEIPKDAPWRPKVIAALKDYAEGRISDYECDQRLAAIYADRNPDRHAAMVKAASAHSRKTGQGPAATVDEVALATRFVAMENGFWSPLEKALGWSPDYEDLKTRLPWYQEDQP